jgi:UDP-3-O-[3-hydroxymyristoyl] N-acetylglucosamine deacetylase
MQRFFPEALNRSKDSLGSNFSMPDWHAQWSEFALSTKSVLSSPQQHTLKARIACAGIGLHTGVITHVCIDPAPPNYGRCFVRTDLPTDSGSELPEIPAQLSTVTQTLLSTTLAQGSAQVRTVEHVLAALAGLGIDNARIKVDGPEIPLLDGSALGWVQAILDVGWVAQATPRHIRSLRQPVWVRQEDAFVVALPAPAPQWTYGIEYELPAIGCQWCCFKPTDFIREIAPARTFCLATDVETLRSRGLIKGGSLESALVCAPEGWLNPPLRYANEPVRHKLLDLIGDLSLLGVLPQAHVLAYKASHTLHIRLAQRLAQSDTSDLRCCS